MAAPVSQRLQAVPAAASLPPPAPWSELIGCLARAYLPPPAVLTSGQWCGALADDLEELGVLLGVDVAVAVDRLRAVVASARAGEPWLVEYSRLFLVPPVRVALNTGLYLEGGIGGTASQMMARCYAAAGYAQREDFHDLPDHVAIQLEFIAALLAQAEAGDAEAAGHADEFIESFVLHWAVPLRVVCDRAAIELEAAAVYAALARLLEGLLEVERSRQAR